MSPLPPRNPVMMNRSDNQSDFISYFSLSCGPDDWEEHFGCVDFFSGGTAHPQQPAEEEKPGQEPGQGPEQEQRQEQEQGQRQEQEQGQGQGRGGPCWYSASRNDRDCRSGNFRVIVGLSSWHLF